MNLKLIGSAYRIDGIVPMQDNCDHTLWIAFRRDEDRPLVCVNCLTFASGIPEASPHTFVDWIEVTTEYRRMGFGTELLRALESRIPDLIYDAATDDGEKFLDAYEKSEEPTHDR